VRTPIKEWGKALIRVGRGKNPNDLVACPANAQTILTCHEDWNDVLAFDEFEGAAVTLKVPPWRKQDRPANAKPGPWTDTDTTRLRAWLAANEELVLSKSDTDEAVNASAARRVVHPVREYLSSLKWDGKPRLDVWLIDYCGAPDTKYVRAVSRIALIGAVARVMRPGCKLDTMLVLQGPQGVGKSSAIAALVPNDDWFTDEFNAETKDGKLALRGVWLVEVGELAALRKAEVETIKAFLSRRVDKYRDPYGRRDGRHPRQCALFGTVNPEQYLRDDTGNRRFLPVTVGAIDLVGLRRDRDQLWAEARVLYEQGAPWHLTDAATITDAQEQQEARRVADPREEILAKWLAGEEKHGEHKGIARAARGVTTAEVLTGALEMPRERATKTAQMDAAALLAKCEWIKCPNRHTLGDARVWLYHPAAKPCPACAARWNASLEKSEKKVGQVGQVGHASEITRESGVQPRKSKVGQVRQARDKKGKVTHAQRFALRRFKRDGDGAHGASLSGESRDALDIATGKASRSLDRKRNGKRSCKLTHMR